jgi:hypothetical protein
MERSAMQEYFGEVRAYFAPVNRSTETGTVFDPSVSFSLDSPPSPWVQLGLVRNFKRVAKSTVGTVRSGAAGVAQSQFRKLTDAHVSLDFCEWGKLQMALAAGSQHMNVLESAGTSPRASGGAAKPGQPVLTGSTSSLILLDASVLSNYAVGELVVVDVDYAAGATELGTGITGGVALTGVQLDADAVRRVSFNVGCVAAITATGLQLDAPLLGGIPAAGAKLQKVVGFVDHEGASFVQEWSALFALSQASGGQVFFYYPRLQAAAPAAETVAALASPHATGTAGHAASQHVAGATTTAGFAASAQGEVNSALLHAEFAALASTDANDGESVVCYRSYVPAPGTPAY